jgi:hypothetical protein
MPKEVHIFATQKVYFYSENHFIIETENINKNVQYCDNYKMIDRYEFQNLDGGVQFNYKLSVVILKSFFFESKS